MRCESLSNRAGGRLVSPSAERNKGFIADVLKEVLPKEGLVLEVSSGTGQHIVHFAQAMPYLEWQPTEQDEECLLSIGRWRDDAQLSNVWTPIRLDVTETPWPIASAAAVVCLNMIHIAPWTAAVALIGGACELLGPGGVLFLYGPFRRGGQHTSESNEAFDRQLRAQNPAWGVRDLETVSRLAEESGFVLVQVSGMPANNLSVVLRRS